MATGKRRDWAHRHNFLVEIGGITYATFQEVTGLDFGFEIVEYREGGDMTSTRKFQGQARAGNITLKGGLVAADTSFRDWVASAERMPTPLKRQSGSIVLKNDAGKEIKRWDFTGSWPVSWRLSDLDSSGTKALLIEELVIAVETIKVHGSTVAGGASGK